MHWHIFFVLIYMQLTFLCVFFVESFNFLACVCSFDFSVFTLKFIALLMKQEDVHKFQQSDAALQKIIGYQPLGTRELEGRYWV